MLERTPPLPLPDVTPHTESATDEAQAKMAELAATNRIEFLEGRTPPNVVKPA